MGTLIDSAALPFLFRKWGDGGSPVLVDGGIGDNLPAAYLDIGNADHLPVCISFKPRDHASANPGSFLSFAMALLDTAIDVANKKSAAMVPHSHFIDTPIETFDFNAALKSLDNGHYIEVKERAKIWFLELIENVRLKRKQRATSDSVIMLHPWQSENPVARLIMKNLWDALEGQFANQQYIFHETELRATLGSLSNAKGSDTIVYKLKFEPADETLYCIILGMTGGAPGQLTREPELSIVCLDTSEFVPHVQVPVLKDPGDTSSRYVAVFFTPGLLKGKQYQLTQTEVGTELMSRLSKDKADDFGIDPSRVKGVIGCTRLVLDIPENVTSYAIKVKPGLRAKTTNEYDAKQVMAALPNLTFRPGYNTHVVEGIAVDGCFAVDVTIGKVL